MANEVPSDLVVNERLKLGAAALNTLATASMTVGVLAPTAAFFYDLSTLGTSAWKLAFGAIIWVLFAGALHYGAQRLLGRLRS